MEVAHIYADMGADSLCIKDMAALLSPYHGLQLVQRIKEEIDLPLELHCHYIGGLAPMTYLKAIEAGVDIVDTATVPLAFGASNPATEMVVSALTGTPYDTGLDLDKLFEIAKYWEEVRIARRLQARRHLAHPYAGIFAPGSRRHDLQPGEPAGGAERPGPAAGGAARRSR